MIMPVEHPPASVDLTVAEFHTATRGRYAHLPEDQVRAMIAAWDAMAEAAVEVVASRKDQS